MSTGFFSWENECARLRAELAAAQATNAKLREALQDIRSHATPIGCRLASKALAIPTDDSVLQERLAQEQERERVEAESQAHMLHDCDVIVQRLMGG